MLSKTFKVFGLLALLGAFALTPAAFAARHRTAIHLTAHQKAVIRARLMRQIKHNPGMIKNKAWLREAGVVQFQLPVTIRLNPSPFSAAGVTNIQDNRAQLDLGPSLGNHTVGLTGSLHATITFVSAFDAGQPGDVNLTLTPSTGGITSTSVPLLSNGNVTHGGDYLAVPSSDTTADGCGNLTANGAPPPAFIPPPTGTAINAGTADDPGNLTNSSSTALTGPLGPLSAFYSAPVGDQPYASGAKQDTTLGTGPVDSVGSGNGPGDVVLRTASLSIGVAAAGAADADSPVAGSTIGSSGGRANLFGLTPTGASAPVDVKVNLFTEINTIVRAVDFLTWLDYNAGGSGNGLGFGDCRQIYTGTVPNYLTTELTGTLHISPALTDDGALRIATTSLSSPILPASQAPAQETVAACLVPDKFYAYGGTAPSVTFPNGDAADPFHAAAATASSPPTEDCNTGTSPFASQIADADNDGDFGTGSPLENGVLVNPLLFGGGTPFGSSGNGYVGNGTEVKVGANLTVTKLVAEVLIGTL